MMRKAINRIGVWKDQFSENVLHCGGSWKDHHPGSDLVLDHIILDLTGDSVPLDKIEDASVKKAFKKKKRLLRHSNTLLFSRLGIMALVAVMLVVTTILTWYFTSTYSARSVKSVATVLRQQLLRTSIHTMVSTLGEIYNGTLVLSALFQQIYLATPNATWDDVEARLRRLNRGYFNAQSQYYSVAFVAADGHVVDYTRYNGSDFYFFVNETSSPNAIWYYQNVTGYLNESQAPPPMRKYPPYPIAAANLLSIEPLEVYWTIRANSLGEAVVSPAVPARDLTTHAFLGAATITSTFQYLNAYLATVDLLDGFLYFEWYNGTGTSSIIAFSYNGSSDILMSPATSSNPIVRAAAQFLAARRGEMISSPGETHAEDVILDGNKYYIDTARVVQPPYNALNLTAVMIVPRASIMGRIDRWNEFVVHVIIGTSVGVLVLGCCFICFLTSRMSTEMQLRQELIRLLVGKHRAEQSSNYKTQFLANMSHELRTPIAGIIGLLDLLACDSLTLEQEFSVSQIQRCATGLLALVNNVLDISKVEAGRMELKTASFSVADELESLVDMFAAQSVDSNIDIILDLSDNIPPVVRGDSSRIRQIFSNLLSNSLKFTTEGHVLCRGWVDQSLLESAARPTDFSLNLLSGRERVSGPILISAETQLVLVFEVEDSGCGIPPELHETVFDSFVQGDSSTTRTHGGSGLGLYIVRSLVELMGGEVAVVPIEGQQGCVMRFHIIVERAFDPMLAGHRSSAEGQTLGPHSERDALDSFLGSSFDLYEPYKRSLPEGVEGTQVLVAMESGVARNVAVDWLERCGLKVTCVEAWAQVLPTLENICKNISVEPKSGAVLGTDDPGGGQLCSLSFRTSFRSPESMSQGSEDTSETVNGPPVLALVDVTLIRSMKLDLDKKLVDAGVLGPNESKLSISEVEKLPSLMQDMLDGMLRIHFQRSVAVSWVVGPDCGAKWKQALQADGCFLVLNKPLHGSRLRRLLSFLARAGKLDQNHWEVHSNWELHSNSMFGSPLSPVTPFPEVKNLEKTCSLDGGRDLVQYAKSPSLRTSIFRKRSLDEARTDHWPDRGVKDTGLEGSSKDAPRSVTSFHSGEELSVLSGSQKAEAIPKGTSESLSNSSEIPRIIQPDEKGNPFVQPTNLNRTSSGIQKYQKVSPVDIPYGPDESRSLLSISTPESPLSGRSTPEISGQSTPEGPGRGVTHPEGEIASADGVQEMRKHGVRARDLDEQVSGRVTDLGLSRKLEQKPEGQTSHEKPFVRLDRANSPTSAFIPNALSGINILLVEDTAVLQRLVSMTLKKLGANVTVVGDGLQAVTAVAETVEVTRDDAPRPTNIPHFDLILMDCAMPVMDGYNATIAIREAEENTDRHIPIVALTAHALASDEERCLSVGMDAYLTKPIDRKLMVTTIRRLL